jgi:hypothetical protein
VHAAAPQPPLAGPAPATPATSHPACPHPPPAPTRHAHPRLPPPPPAPKQVLEGLEPVRKRPGMYIGSTGARGLHHLLWEVLDNAVDEVQAGHATAVDVEIDLDSGAARVTDNGR